MIDIDTFDWKKYIDECLNSTNFCCLGTIDSENGVWTNPVYFAWDENYNFYFISQMRSRHMQNIKDDQRVSISIYKTEQGSDVCGTYIEGCANTISTEDNDEVQNARDVYYQRAGSGPDVQEYKNNPTWLYIKITPSKIHYFDTRYFGEERQTVPLEKLK